MENQLFFIIIIIVILIIYYTHCHYTFLNLEKFSNLTNQQNQMEYGDFYTKPKKSNKSNNSECSGDLLTLNPYQRCNVLAKKKFMIRDIRTQLWLISGQEEGFSKFLPGRFGITLALSENPDEYLPLRTLADPNDYLLSTYNGKGIRTVSNPNSQYYILQIFIYNGHNVIGYIDESDTQKYLYVDDNGNITSTVYPENASTVELLFV